MSSFGTWGKKSFYKGILYIQYIEKWIVKNYILCYYIVEYIFTNGKICS